MKPAPHAQRPRDVFRIILLDGVERVTYGLRHNHEFDLRDLEPLVNRCRAMVEAYEWRVKETGE